MTSLVELRKLAEAAKTEQETISRHRRLLKTEDAMRYVLHPSYVISQTDGQEHFIGGSALARLYGISHLMRDKEKVVFGDVPEYIEQVGDIPLRPRYDGNYTLPERAL